MDDSFFRYLELLEILAFFSGYPLVFALIRALDRKNKSMDSGAGRGISRLLPLSYALTGVLFLGLQLKNLYPDYTLANIRLSIHAPYLKLWGLMALLFWLPIFRKRPQLSLLHGLSFFFLLIKDFFFPLANNPDNSFLRNDMKIYTNSLIINLASFSIILLIHYCCHYLKKNRNQIH